MPLWLLPLLIGEVVDLGLSRWLILAGKRERLAVQGDGREGSDAMSQPAMKTRARHCPGTRMRPRSRRLSFARTQEGSGKALPSPIFK